MGGIDEVRIDDVERMRAGNADAEATRLIRLVHHENRNAVLVVARGVNARLRLLGMVDPHARTRELEPFAVCVLQQGEGSEGPAKITGVRPHRGDVNAHACEHSERVGRREAARDVPAAAREVLGHAELRSGISGGNAILEPLQDVRGAEEVVVRDPRVLVVIGIPVAARALQDRVISASIIGRFAWSIAHVNVPLKTRCGYQ